jgi:hypothetical protein
MNDAFQVVRFFATRRQLFATRRQLFATRRQLFATLSSRGAGLGEFRVLSVFKLHMTGSDFKVSGNKEPCEQKGLIPTPVTRVNGVEY